MKFFIRRVIFIVHLFIRMHIQKKVLLVRKEISANPSHVVCDDVSTVCCFCEFEFEFILLNMTVQQQTSTSSISFYFFFSVFPFFSFCMFTRNKKSRQILFSVGLNTYFTKENDKVPG